MAVDLLADDAPAPANPPAKPVSAPVDLLADDGGTDLLSDVGGAPAKPAIDMKKVQFAPGGVMWSADPATQKAINEQNTEFAKGVASGAAQTAVGIPQGISNWTPGHKWLDDYFAETQQKLKGFGDKGAQQLGEMAPWLFGGEILGAGKLAAGEVAGLASKVLGAAKAGEYLAPAGEAIASGAKTAKEAVGKVIPESVKGAYNFLTGPSPKAAAAAANAEQMKEKLTAAQKAMNSLKEISKSTVTGAGLGAGMGVVAPRAEQDAAARDQAAWNSVIDGITFGGIFGAAGGALVEFAKTLPEAVSAWRLSDKKKAFELAEQALKEKQDAALKLTKEGARRARTEQLTAKSDVAKTEAELAPTESRLDELARLKGEATDRELYEATDAQARDIAGKTNLTKEQAEASVKEQQRLLASIKEESERQSAAQFGKTAQVSDVEAGKTLAPKIEKLKADLEEHRKQASGLAQIDEEYKTKGPVFPIKPVIDQINTQIKGTEGGLLGSETVNFLTKLKERLENTAKKLGDENKVTLKQLDDARLEIKDAVNNGLIGVSGGVRTAGADLKKLEPIVQGIDNSFIAVDKRYTDALKNYGALSAPLAPLEQKMGVFAGTTEKYYGGPNEMLPRDIALQVLDRTRGGGEGLQTLVAANPELKDTFREYLHGELFGASKESASEVTAKTLDEFRKKNAEVLKSTGLTEEFADLAQARRANEQTIQSAEKRLAEAEELQGETGKRLSMEERRRARETKKLKATAAPLRQTKEQGAKTILNAKSKEDALRRLKAEVSSTTAPEKQDSRLRDFYLRLSDTSPETLNRSALEKTLKELDAVSAEFKRTGDELKRAQGVRAVLSAKALTEIGIVGGTSYGAVRILQGQAH